MTAPPARRRTYTNRPRAYATIPTSLWSDPEFLAFSARARRVYLVIRTAATTGQSGITNIQVSWWAGLLGDSEDDVYAALDELENHGWIYADTETRELIITTMIDEESATRDGDAIERIAREGEAARSDHVRATIAGALSGISQLRAQVAADYLFDGLPLPERGRVSLLAKEELKAKRAQFIGCVQRKLLRAEIAAGLHRCALCGADGTENTAGNWINLTVDHIVSLARGGENERSNYQVLCAECNARKGARG